MASEVRCSSLDIKVYLLHKKQCCAHYTVKSRVLARKFKRLCGFSCAQDRAIFHKYKNKVKSAVAGIDKTCMQE